MKRPPMPRPHPRLLVASLVAAAALFAAPQCSVVHEVTLGELVLRYEQVESRRVGRTLFEYTFAATLETAGDAAAPMVASVTSESLATQVVDDRLEFPAAEVASVVGSLDTFRIRQDRTVAFDPGALDFALAPAVVPEADEVTPSSSAVDVPRTAWPRIAFDDVFPLASLEDVTLECDGAPVAASVDRVGDTHVVLNPDAELPPETTCSLTYPLPGDPELINGFSSFTTAADGGTSEIVYDRTNRALTTPFPDDFWLLPAPERPTGFRVRIQRPEREDDVIQIFRALSDGTRVLDGFSPIAGITVELEDPPDPDSLPTTIDESLDPFAAIGLFDLTPGSPTYGERVPFRLTARSDSVSGEPLSHNLILYPSIPLTPKGRYGFVVTNRLLADETRPFGPSSFFQTVMAPAQPGEDEDVTTLRPIAADVLDALASDVSPPIPPEDVAIALRITVRSIDTIPDDLIAMKEQVLAADPPSFTMDSVGPGFGNIAAVVRGTWQAPDWREAAIGELARDAGGEPLITGHFTGTYTLAIPDAALEGPVPITMYQHGNPGSENEVLSEAAGSLAEAGFAVIGFTDTLNREVGQDEGAQFLQIFGVLLTSRALPAYWIQTYGEQQAFLRLIGSLDELDVLPLGEPDGVPDLDPTLPLTYVGISQGSNHGQAFASVAPEVRAAALVAGATRLGEILFHQDNTDPSGTGSFFFGTLPDYVPHILPSDIWVGLQLFQMLFDAQDPHNYASFVYRDPRLVAGTRRKPSLLVVEGIGDNLVRNNATRSLAWILGPIPHLQPVQQPVPFLTPADGPISANVDAETTAAFVQFTPAGVPGIPTEPGCESEPEGHYCAQVAPNAREQRVRFFLSAVNDPVPVISDPRAD